MMCTRVLRVEELFSVFWSTVARQRQDIGPIFQNEPNTRLHWDHGTLLEISYLLQPPHQQQLYTKKEWWFRRVTNNDVREEERFDRNVFFVELYVQPACAARIYSEHPRASQLSTAPPIPAAE